MSGRPRAELDEGRRLALLATVERIERLELSLAESVRCAIDEEGSSLRVVGEAIGRSKDGVSRLLRIGREAK